MSRTISENQLPNVTISPLASIGKNVKIGPYTYIANGAVIEDGTIIEPGVVVYENVRVGRNSFIGAQAVLGERLADHLDNNAYVNPPLIIGQESIIRSGTIIYAGCEFGAHFQTGNRAVIREYSQFGDHCSFGTLSQSDGHIKVGDYCRFHNNVFIATYTTIENHVLFFPMSCTTDSLHPPCTKGREGPHVESGAIIGAKVLLLPRVKIGRGAVIAGGSVVTHDVPPNMVAAGSPARIIKDKSQVRCHIEDRPAYEVAVESID